MCSLSLTHTHSHTLFFSLLVFCSSTNRETTLSDFRVALEELQTLRERQEAAAELIGEKEQEILELHNDMREMKEAFREQVKMLILQQQQGEGEEAHD